ncbi:MAG: SDR family NAD(P)-dependent oxidoreductase [Rhodospirillales bacterium]|nr:SDR family NAD(P)-dependent oxidoreductase [Rhodospirillales bacterium]
MVRKSIFNPGNVAVVTGAASGIGKAAGRRFATYGLSVCLIDLPGENLDAAVAEVSAVASDDKQYICGIPTDLSDADQIRQLHDHVMGRFGKVNFLMNNAVTRIGRGHGAELAEWRQAMEVNFWGVVNAVRAFLPGMLSMDEPGIILNVGSKQGITNPPGHPIYNITKSALKTYTESLEHEIRSDPDNQGENSLSAHLLVPGWTTTGDNPHQEGAWLPDQVVDFMVEALDRGDFYILCPDGEVTTEMDHKRILWGAQDITESRPPLSRWHPDYAERAKKKCS